MKKKLCLLILFSLIGISLMPLAEAEDATCPCPGGIDTDLWILAGQSNMYGWAPLPLEPDKPNPHVWMFGLDNRWMLAQDPLHRGYEAEAPIYHEFMLGMCKTEEQYLEYRAQSKKTPIGGVGPGLFFAKQLERVLDKPIGLIPSSPGGCRIEHYSPALKDKQGGSVYGALMERIAMAGGRVKGVLWYQGEGDVPNPETAQGYGKALLELIDALRRDTGNPELPFLCVQIGHYTRANNPALDHNWDTIREAQRQVQNLREHVYVVSAIDLPLTDHIHLSYEGQERMGKRLAEIALSKVYHVQGHGESIDFTGAELIEPDSATPSIRVHFTGVTGKLLAQGRPTGFMARFPNETGEIPEPYQVDFDPNDPATVILRFCNPLPKGPVELFYAEGMNPYANITDEKDMPLPAFGPIELARPESENKQP